jgi:hypothetical protein
MPNCSECGGPTDDTRLCQGCSDSAERHGEYQRAIREAAEAMREAAAKALEEIAEGCFRVMNEVSKVSSQRLSEAEGWALMRAAVAVRNVPLPGDPEAQP